MYKVNDDVYGEVNPDELLEVVDWALRRTLDTERSVGFCLSGGLDSTTLVKLAERYGTVETFSTTFPGTSADESEYLMDALDGNIIAHLITPGAPTLEDINTLMKIQGGPFPSLSLYVQYKLIELASHHVDVLVDGQGPDELLCGYIGYQSTYIKELFRRHYYLEGLKEGMWSLRYHWRELLKSRYVDTTQFKGSLNEVLDRDILNSLYLELNWLHRTADYFGVVVDSPYADPSVVHFCMDLPYQMKIRNGTSKWILRQATRGLIPESIRLRQTKLGFPAPEPEWMKHELQSIVLDTLEPGSDVMKMYTDFLRGRKPYRREIWQVVCDVLWGRLQK